MNGNLLKSLFLAFVLIVLVRPVSAQTSSELITKQVAVELKEAGTLGNLLDESQRSLITNLKLKGNINGTDIHLLREMLGVSEIAGTFTDDKLNAAHSYETEPTGSNLTTLDLKDANIVEGGDCYAWKLTGATPQASYTELYTTNNVLGYGMFRDCNSLTQLILPSTIQSVERFSLSGCTGLTALEIPDQVGEIGVFAFYACTSLTSLVLPKALTMISTGMVAKCEALESIDIPETVEDIATKAFSESGLKTFTIPPLVTTITPFLLGCEKLETITIPNTVTRISSDGFNGAFAWLTSLKELRIPESVSGSLGDFLLRGCSSLQTLYIPSRATLTQRTLQGFSTLNDLYVYWDTPQQVNQLYIQKSFDYKQCTLHVKKGCKDAYAAAYYWKSFKAIVEDADEDEFTGIANVAIEDTSSPQTIYSLDGKQRISLAPGINIIRYADGKVKKVMK